MADLVLVILGVAFIVLGGTMLFDSRGIAGRIARWRSKTTDISRSQRLTYRAYGLPVVFIGVALMNFVIHI